jgi:hypothetical protein
MFSVRQKRLIAQQIQDILRATNHPELAPGEIVFEIKIKGAQPWSWAIIRNNLAITDPGINPWNEAQDREIAEGSGPMPLLPGQPPPTPCDCPECSFSPPEHSYGWPRVPGEWVYEGGRLYGTRTGNVTFPAIHGIAGTLPVGTDHYRVILQPISYLKVEANNAAG